MSKHMWCMVLLVCALLAIAGVATASAPDHRVDWLVPFTGNGGAPASSAHYAVNLTLGQTALGVSSSAGHSVSLGYWAGIAVAAGPWPTPNHWVYLPVLMKQLWVP